MMKQTVRILFSVIITAVGLLPVIDTYAQGLDQSVTNLGDVVIRFCNEDAQAEPGKMKSLFLDVDTETDQDICIYVNNSGPTDVDVQLNFVDGTISADDGQNKACQPEGTKSQFWQYVDFIDEVLTVEAGTTLETHANLKFPDGYSGMSYGCVTMKFVNEDEDEDEREGQMFDVVARRGYFIDVLVGWEINLDFEVLDQADTYFENIGNSKKIGIYKTDQWVIKARITVENPGNIAQEVSVIPTFRWMFQDPVKWRNVLKQSIINNQIVDEYLLDWEDSDDAFDVTKKVLPKQQVSFEFVLDDIIPFWKWTMELDAIVKNKPVFDYVVADINPEILKENVQTLHTKFVLIPWSLIGLSLAIILLLLIISMKKNRPVSAPVVDWNAKSSKKKDRKKSIKKK